MRADRLIATLLLMQNRGRVTASELAAELEVSVATARRDLEALSAAGIPVYPQPGRGGGWALVGGARTDLSGLSAGEAQALFLLAGPAAAVSDDARAALRKLVRALPQTFRTDAQAAASSTMIDSTRWGERHRHRPAMVELLQTAVVQRRKVRLEYENRQQRSERLVDPWGLIDKDDVWYLIAGTEKGQRTFRVDRIVSADQTDEKADRPVDFDLDAAWRQVTDAMEERRSRTWATVTIAARFAPILNDHFGRHVQHQDDGDDGDAGNEDDGDSGDSGDGEHRVRVRVGAPTARDIARTLAGWGSMVEVLDPPAVRAELARIGSELVSRYA